MSLNIKNYTDWRCYYGDEPCPVESGAVGTVITVDDIGTVHVEFDNGRSLGICPEVDSFHKITEQIEAQEPKMSM